MTDEPDVVTERLGRQHARRDSLVS